MPSKATPHERLSECERSSQWQKLGPFIAISCDLDFESFGLNDGFFWPPF